MIAVNRAYSYKYLYIAYILPVSVVKPPQRAHTYHTPHLH